jgi:hypothetical protein
MYMVYMALCLFLASCSHLSPVAQHKAWERFDGRLLVMEPNRRWQVFIHWQADLEQGFTRLTHAASSRIIELKWNGNQTYIRDNQAQPQWKKINNTVLMQYGIVLPPQTLSKILHNQIPPSLHHKDNEIWQGKLHGSIIRLRWQDDMHKLTMTDITHGRSAILRIQP